MSIFFGLLGGLALFLYGMFSMGEGLQKAAGERMRKILEVLTGIPVVGVLMGTLVTAIIQSSSATTVMVVGFVNAGLMTLKQAISVIMGTNIGTTMTAQLIAFKLSDYYLPIIGIGFLVFFLAKKKSIKYIGQVFFGFGLLLLGLYIMGDAMKPLGDYPGFKEFMVNFGKYKILGVGVGILMTVLIQSSSATIGILIALATQGLIPLDVALPVLFGDNIGTCITAVLASIGTKLSAKRAAIAHVLFNVTGTIIFITFLPYFKMLVLSISPEGDIARQIANAHTSFNILNTCLFLPFITLYTNLITRLVPGEEKIIKKGPVYLDKRVLNTPSVALSLASKELIRMGRLAKDNLDNAMTALLNKDSSLIKDVLDIEDVIDELESEITEYLSQINQKGLTKENSVILSNYLHAVNDIERVGDHANNIIEYAETCIEDNIIFTPFAINEISEMHKFVSETFSMSIQALKDNDVVKAGQVLENESKIDEIEKSLRKSHIGRLNEGQCIVHAGVIFLDIISNLERVGDHAHNIASLVKQ
ncbi:MAG: Na/Pi cotransporter family protein [Bacillota bacterium]|jgi:phosphate:Na+ symporter